MKKIALAAVMAVLMSGAAKADWFDYVAVGGGATQSPDLNVFGTDSDMEMGYNLGIMVGWNQSDQISIAGDVGFVESEYEDGAGLSLQALGIMGDVMYMCDTGDFWHPYIGAGLGTIELRLDQAGPFSGSEWVFGYQAMAGISFDVDDSHGIFVGYKYQASEDASINGIPDIEYESHNISIGVLFD
jgi:opacity protein-like surface antigen